MLVLCVAVALALSATSGSAGAGNADNAKQCQKGGWTTYTRADGTSFANQGACVSYAARGGSLVPKDRAQVLCESFGGTFGMVNYGIGGTVLWSCSEFTGGMAAVSALAAECANDPDSGDNSQFAYDPPFPGETSLVNGTCLGFDD
jgi:hypothetical protein